MKELWLLRSRLGVFCSRYFAGLRMTEPSHPEPSEVSLSYGKIVPVVMALVKSVPVMSAPVKSAPVRSESDGYLSSLAGRETFL